MKPRVNVIVRKAEVSDIESLYELIQSYAEKGIMLPRTRAMLADQLDYFVVAEHAGVMIGCGSLCRLGKELVEIRSLGVNPEYKGQGIGTQILSILEQEARKLHIPKLMALTYEVRFFERNGFHVVQKEIFPEKVWKDCVNCKKQHCCDEIAVLKMLD